MITGIVFLILLACLLLFLDGKKSKNRGNPKRYFSLSYVYPIQNHGQDVYSNSAIYHIDDDLGEPVSSIVDEPFPTTEEERIMKESLPSDDDDVIEVDPVMERTAMEYVRKIEEIDKAAAEYELEQQEKGV